MNKLSEPINISIRMKTSMHLRPSTVRAIKVIIIPKKKQYKVLQMILYASPVLLLWGANENPSP